MVYVRLGLQDIPFDSFLFAPSTRFLKMLYLLNLFVIILSGKHVVQEALFKAGCSFSFPLCTKTCMPLNLNHCDEHIIVGNMP